MSIKKEFISHGNLTPFLHPEETVFCFVSDFQSIPFAQILFYFKEDEGYTIVLYKKTADDLKWVYDYIAAWITLRIHTELSMVGLTAQFSTALANAGISCNVVAAFHHDHLFVDYNDKDKAMEVLNSLQIINQ